MKFLLLLGSATIVQCIISPISSFVTVGGVHQRRHYINPPSSSLFSRETTSFSRVGVIRRSKNTTLSASALATTTKMTGLAIGSFYRSYPALASFLTASILACIADIVAQIMDECTKRLEKRRVLGMVLYSGLVSGICVEFMYSSVFPVIFGVTEGGFLRAIRMTIFDECINAPFLWLPPAYMAQAIVYGTSIREAIQKYITDVREHGLLIKYWSIWIPMSLFNFAIVPLHFRVAFVAVVSFFWMIILSIVANRKESNSNDEDKLCEPEPSMGSKTTW